MSIIRSMHNTVIRLLFITLGAMWLSVTIAPCVLLAAVENNHHDCCPEAGIKTTAHTPGQKQCDTCYKAQPLLKSTNQLVLTSANSGSNFHPVIVEWNYIPASEPTGITYKKPVTRVQSLPPPLRYRVLLI